VGFFSGHDDDIKRSIGTETDRLIYNRPFLPWQKKPVLVMYQSDVFLLLFFFDSYDW